MLIAATGDVLLCYSLKGFYFKEKGFVGMVACVWACGSACTGWLFYFAFFLPLKEVIVEVNDMTVDFFSSSQ